MIVEATARFLFSRLLPGNGEFRVQTWTEMDSKTGATREVMDFRRWWFRDGTQFPSQPSKAGVLVPKSWMCGVALAILKELKPEEISGEDRDALNDELDRLLG